MLLSSPSSQKEGEEIFVVIKELPSPEPVPLLTSLEEPIALVLNGTTTVTRCTS